MSKRSFAAVVESLNTYTARTGKPPLMLGGWEPEDPMIRPPAVLAVELSAVSPCLRSYTYMRDLHVAKQAAAHLFDFSMRLAGQRIAAENIALFQNSTQTLLLTLAALKQRGVEQVVVAAPGYFSVVEVCQHLGLSFTIVPAADFVTGVLDMKAIVTMMQRRPSALVVTNPAYSVGMEYEWPSLHSLFATLPPGSYVVLDETRLGLHWQHEAPWYDADYPRHVLIIRSPSKIFFVNGLKLSLMIGMPELIRTVELLSESLVGSVPGATEQIALAYLKCLQQWVDEVRTGDNGALRQWRREIVACLKRNSDTVRNFLGEQDFVFSPVDSGPYLLACVAREKVGEYGLTAMLDSCAIAQKVGVLLMNSSYFFHEHRDWLGFRVNLCAQHQHIVEAVARVFEAPTANNSHVEAQPAARN